MTKAANQVAVAIAVCCLVCPSMAKEPPAVQWSDSTATVDLRVQGRGGRVSGGIDKAPFQDRARVAHVEFVNVTDQDIPKVSAFLEGSAPRSYRFRHDTDTVIWQRDGDDAFYVAGLRFDGVADKDAASAFLARNPNAKLKITLGPPRAPALVIYQDSGFKKKGIVLPPGDYPDLDRVGPEDGTRSRNQIWNKSISSYECYDVTCIFYSQPNYKGKSLDANPIAAGEMPKGWNDVPESCRVTKK